MTFVYIQSSGAKSVKEENETKNNGQLIKPKEEPLHFLKSLLCRSLMTTSVIELKRTFA